jgi:hypothetical protein
MKYFYIEPEVAGSLGRNTIMDCDVHPPVVSKLHYHFDGWLGGVLLESFPCFIVTEVAKQRIQEAGLTGTRFEEVEVTASEQFQEFYPNRRLPKFVWLRVQGKAAQEDFGTAEDGRLVVSEKSLQILRQLGAAQALITSFAV